MLRRIDLPLPHGLRAAGLARNAVRRAGRVWDADTLSTVVLLTSEVVTNAIRYGRAPLHLAMAFGSGAVRVEVFDGGTVAMLASQVAGRHSMPSPEALGGRGLPLLNLLASGWGAYVVIPRGPCHRSADPDLSSAGVTATGHRRAGPHVVWFEVLFPSPAGDLRVDPPAAQ